MATTSDATEVDKVDSSVGQQQLQSNCVELQEADIGVVQLGIKSDFNESSTVEFIDNCAIGTSDGIQCSGEDVVYNLGENDGCSITPPRGPGCKSGCNLCPSSFKADGVDIKVDEGYPCLYEKLKKVFNSTKIWLMGCSSAEHIIQSHLDKLEDGEAASDMLLRRIESLTASLSTCSVDLLRAGNSTHDALRVEVVSRLLYSTLVSVLQERTLFDGIEHLERLTQDRDYFNQEVAAYGYAGITLTTIGSLQMATTELFKNGKVVLQKLSLPESFLLTHDDVRMWYCYHCLIWGDCCFQLKEYKDSKPWYEAALRVAKFGLTYPETVSHGNPDSNAESPMAEARHNEWKTTAAECHSHIAMMYHNVANYEEAAKHWYDAAKLHDDRIKGKDAQTKGDKALTSLFYSGDAVKALDATKQLLLQISNLDSNLSMRRAELLAFKGRIEAFKGDFDDSIFSLKEAKRYYEEKGCLEDSELVTINLYLLLVYSRKHDYRAAIHIVRGFQDVINRYHKHTMRWFLWEAHKAHIYVDLGEFETASLILDQVEVPEAKNWKRLEAFVASVRAKLYLYENHRDIESVQDQYDMMEKSIKEVQVHGLPVGPNLPIAGVANMRSMYLNIDNWNIQDLEKRYDICQQRVVLLRDKVGEEIELARALFRQAVTIGKRLALMQEWNHQDYEINKLIDEAIQLVETRDRRFLAILKFAKTVFIQNFDPSTGESEGYDAAFIFAELQLNLKDLETAWIGLFELEMMHIFSFMQYISLLHYKTPIKALLWAERGRTRLFMHLTKHDGNTDLLNVEKAALERVAQQASVSHALEHQEPKFELHGRREQASSSRESLGKRQGNYLTNQKPLESLTQVVEGNYGNAKKLGGSDELWFDRDDVLAEKYLLDAVEKCGSGALILEYTVWEEMRLSYIIYAVFIDEQGRLDVKHEILLISDYYSLIKKEKGKWLWGETLKDLIDKTREFISKAKDYLAMEGLSMLHSLLIAPVQKYVDKCQRLILAVHDDLALVPFAALYNKRRKKFLVQEKMPSYIPSIRVLQYCFHRQTEFKQNMQKKLLGPPFIAGNPESMPGWGMKALRRAGEEATHVAQMLGVRPYIGLDMTKNAVTNGLSNGSIVLLATHGLVDEFYPHGVLILQDRNSSSSDLSGSSSMTLTNVNKDVDATISSHEIASLPGGIRAGLVVLSACETAKGKVTSEGLLGLGRALLQGGAPTAILTLWEVGDFSNKVLVEGMFQKFVDEGKDAAESLQLTMWQMMNDETNGKKKYSIYQWASLVVLGSPVLKYNSTTLLGSENMCLSGLSL